MRFSKCSWMLFAVFVLLPASSALADDISFTVSDTTLTTTSGGTVTFEGTVTNDSGGDLNASDFFFNFFGYDPTSVNPIQDLGVSTDFLIPNGSTSATVDLFDVTLGAVPSGSSFPIEVQLEDINGDLSAVETVTVDVESAAGGGGSSGGSGPVPAPEPGSFVLLCAGLLGLTFMRKRIAHSS